MKTKRYTIIFLLITIAVFVFSSSADAQRRRGRNYHRNYYPQRYYAYNRPFVSLNFGGYNYRYQRGYFYRPYGSVFRISVPPIGIRIRTLPMGYRTYHYGPDPYYYYQGTYYRPYGPNEYQVVAPPLGSVVDELPPGAKVKVIDGQKYYELNGTYYREDINEDDELTYTVVGTDGVLNTDGGGNTSAPSSTPPAPRIGDRINELPEGSKAVVIRGEKLYATPSGYYYKEIVDGDKVSYELVGK